ncbi:GTPase activating factor [Balamuthia mandrillaris]
MDRHRKDTPPQLQKRHLITKKEVRKEGNPKLPPRSVSDLAQCSRDDSLVVTINPLRLPLIRSTEALKREIIKEREDEEEREESIEHGSENGHGKAKEEGQEQQDVVTPEKGSPTMKRSRSWTDASKSKKMGNMLKNYATSVPSRNIIDGKQNRKALWEEEANAEEEEDTTVTESEEDTTTEDATTEDEDSKKREKEKKKRQVENAFKGVLGPERHVSPRKNKDKKKDKQKVNKNNNGEAVGEEEDKKAKKKEEKKRLSMAVNALGNSDSKHLTKKEKKEMKETIWADSRLSRLLVSPTMELITGLEEGLPCAFHSEVAFAMLSLFELCSREQHLLRWAVTRDVERFVRNEGKSKWPANGQAGLAAEVLQSYLFSRGWEFLKEALRPFILSLTSKQQQSKELDMDVNAKDQKKRQRSQQNVKTLCKCLIEEYILPKAESLSTNVKFLYVLATVEMKKREPKLVNKIVASIFFLRFFCPVLQSPHLYRIFQGQPNRKVITALQILSQALVQVATGRKYKDKADKKPTGFSFMNDFVDEMQDKITEFVNKATSIPSTSEAVRFEGLSVRPGASSSLSSASTATTAAASATPLSSSIPVSPTSPPSGGFLEDLSIWKEKERTLLLVSYYREKLGQSLMRNNKEPTYHELMMLLDKHILGERIIKQQTQRVKMLEELQERRHEYDDSYGSSSQAAVVPFHKYFLLEWYASTKPTGSSSSAYKGALSALSGSGSNLNTRLRFPRKMLKGNKTKSSSASSSSSNIHNLSAVNPAIPVEKASKSLIRAMLLEEKAKNERVEEEMKQLLLKIKEETRSKRDLELQILKRKEKGSGDFTIQQEQTIMNEFAVITSLMEAMKLQLSTLEQEVLDRPILLDAAAEEAFQSGVPSLTSRGGSSTNGTASSSASHSMWGKSLGSFRKKFKHQNPFVLPSRKGAAAHQQQKSGTLPSARGQGSSLLAALDISI